jgi:hypothetical protein
VVAALKQLKAGQTASDDGQVKPRPIAAALHEEDPARRGGPQDSNDSPNLFSRPSGTDYLIGSRLYSQR